MVQAHQILTTYRHGSRMGTIVYRQDADTTQLNSSTTHHLPSIFKENPIPAGTVNLGGSMGSSTFASRIASPYVSRKPSVRKSKHSKNSNTTGTVYLPQNCSAHQVI